MNGRRGFTLIEVIVALGIAATSLILLLSANQESLRRSLRSRQAINVRTLAESKLDEIATGVEAAEHGTFAELPGARWDVQVNPVEVEGVNNLKRLELTVRGADGQIAATLVTLQYKDPAEKR